MNKEKFTEDAYLYLLNELSAQDKIEFENALMQDDRLNGEFQKIQADFKVFVHSKPETINDATLTSARNSLMRKLREESTAPSYFSRFIEKIKSFFYYNYGYALGGLVTFALGIGIGYMLLFSKGAQKSLTLDKPIEITSPNENSSADNNNSSEKYNTQGNYSNKSSVFSSENLNSPAFREALIQALIGGSNPGVRIKSISTISEHAKEESFKPDPAIKKALITALKKDDNPAVRREALIVLQRYPYDKELRDVLLYVLSNDKNSGLRVAAINALADWNQQSKIIDEVLKQALAKKAQADKNTFVQIRAASILKEVE